MSLMLMGCEVWIEAEISFNQAPVAVITATPTTGYAKLWVQFDGSSSYDLDGEIVSYHWDFGDGHTGSGMKVSHLFEDDSDRDNDGWNEGYIAKLTVIDDQGAWDETSILITVYNPAPVASFSFSPQVPQVLEWVKFDASSSYDPDEMSVQAAHIVAFQWNFGDGNFDQGKVAWHQYKKPGIYQVTLKVIDDDGAFQTFTQFLRVNHPPVADFTWYDCSLLLAESLASKPKPEGIVPVVCKVFDAKTSYDPDGWITKYEWDFGDGTTGSGKVVWHEFLPGTYTIKLTVTDNDGAVSQKRRSIHF